MSQSKRGSFFEACVNTVIGVFDYRKSQEHKGSFDINLWEKSDIVIPNSSSMEDLRKRVTKLKPLFSNGI